MSRKTPTMQEMYGTIDGKECRTCEHRYQITRSRTCTKCELWMKHFSGSSAASDIHLRDTACGKYQEEEL